MKTFCAYVLLGLAAIPEVGRGQGPAVVYALEQAGQVSLLLQAADGRVVRELLHAARREAGPQREVWDGLDERGQPVPAGTYTWKLLASDGLKAEYLMSLGTTAVPPWKQMPGNHNGVMSAAVDEAGALYLSAGCSEGPPQIVKQSLDGQSRHWEAAHVFDGWQGGASAAAMGGRLYAMQVAGVVMVVDGQTGKRLARWELAWNQEELAEEPGLWRTMDMAGRAGTLVVSHKLRDAVRWIDPENGQVVAEATVPAPQAVAVAADGRVLLVSHDTVVALDREARQPSTVIGAGHLRDAYRLDVCPATGDILVAERGAGQQVKRFDAGGKLRQTLGREGGRRDGAYEPNDFREIFDITADGEGGFIVCEGVCAPRRTARFDRDGKLLADWYGGQMYANHAVADPADPSVVWVDSHFGTIIKAKLDYAAKSWRILATYAFGGMAEGFIPGTTHGGGRFVVRHRDGQTYLCRDDTPVVLREDEANRRLVPLVASDPIIVHDWPATPAVAKRAIYPDHDPSQPYPTPGWDGFGHRGWMWMDANGDGRPAVEEIGFGKFWGWFTSRWHVDDQLGYARLADQQLQRLSVREWTAHGVPLFAGWDAMQPIPAAMPDWLAATQGDYAARGRIACVGIWPDGEGGWFAAFNDGNRPFGMGYLSAKAGANRVVRWDAAGKLLWEVGRHSADLGARPGEARSFFRTAGVAHGCVVVTDYECYYEIKNLVHVWDRDGLWVGRLLEQPDLEAAPAAAYTLCTENFGGSLVEITAEMSVPGLETGDVVFFGSGQNDTRVYRITGWETMRRQAGTVEMPADFAATVTAAVAKEAERTDVARIGRLEAAKVDADLKKWEKTTPLAIRMGDRELAKLYLGWNPDGLFVCFDVTTDRPWQSRSSVTEAFTGGAAVDVNLGPLTPADRWQPVAGDVRYVAAPIGQHGREVLVEFLPYLLPGLPPQKQPVTFETAAQGKVTFERVAAREATAVASRLKADDSGYVVELRIPMRAPLKPAPGHRFKLDASVILADFLDGTTSDARLCWHSRAPEDQLVAADQVIEATLRPANWGEAVFE